MLEQFKRDGFLKLDQYLDPSVVSNIVSEAQDIFTFQIKRHGIHNGQYESTVDFEQALYALFAKDRDAFVGCGKLCQHMIQLHQLSLSDKLLDLVKSVGLEKPVISTRPVMFFNSPHLAVRDIYHKTPAHQDWGSMQGSLDSVVIWIPLIDINKELGAIDVIPRSHTKGLLDGHMDDGFWQLDEAALSEDEFVSVEVKAGDVVIFSAFLVHRSGNNVTDHIRWSTHFRYNSYSDTTFIERGYPHAYVYHPVKEILTPDFPKQNDLDSIFS